MTTGADRSEEFPVEAMHRLVRIATTFDVGLIAIGLVLAVSGWVAGGLEVAVLGLTALIAVAMLRPRPDPGP